MLRNLVANITLDCLTLTTKVTEQTRLLTMFCIIIFICLMPVVTAHLTLGQLLENRKVNWDKNKRMTRDDTMEKIPDCIQPDLNIQLNDCLENHSLTHLDKKDYFKEEGCWIQFNYLKCLANALDLCEDKSLSENNLAAACSLANNRLCKEYNIQDQECSSYSFET